MEMKAIEARNMEDMDEHVRAAVDFLKALAHESRLMILCLLVDGEKSVSELEELTQLRQSNVSQHLYRLRSEGLVHTRRDGQTIYYALGRDEAKQILALLYDLYCGEKS